MVISFRLLIVLDNGRVLQRRARHWLKERVVSISVPGMPSQLRLTALAHLALAGRVTERSELARGRGMGHLLSSPSAPLRHALFDVSEMLDRRLTGH